MYINREIYLLLFYLVLFICVYGLAKNNLSNKSLFGLLVLLIPCICILPGTVEIRFFVAMHIMMYVYACWNIKDYFIMLKKKEAKLLMLFMSGLVLYLSYMEAI